MSDENGGGGNTDSDESDNNNRQTTIKMSKNANNRAKSANAKGLRRIKSRQALAATGTGANANTAAAGNSGSNLDSEFIEKVRQALEYMSRQDLAANSGGSGSGGGKSRATTTSVSGGKIIMEKVKSKGRLKTSTGVRSKCKIRPKSQKGSITTTTTTTTAAAAAAAAAAAGISTGSDSKILRTIKSKGRASKCKQRPKSRGGLSTIKSSGPRGGTTTTAKMDQQQYSEQAVAAPPTYSLNDAQTIKLFKCLLEKINASATFSPQAAAQQQTTTTATTNSELSAREQKQLEELYDALFELTNDVLTLQDSYEKIIKSLINLQHRRESTSPHHHHHGAVAKGKSLLPLVNEPGGGPIAKKGPDHGPGSGPSIGVPGSLERFMDSATRSEAFRQLFAAAESLKGRTATFMACFDSAGYIDAAAYRMNRMTNSQREIYLAEARALQSTVTAILQEYNKEVLDMFRISNSQIV